MSFINAFFLFATAAAALPVLYHLVRRRKAKQVPFSSLMFLKATPHEVIRKRRLKDRLLMAARMAIFALLALAFARPYLPQERIPFVSQRQDRSVVMLVDRSYSMRYDGAFEQAIAAAEAELEAAGPEDEVAVITFANDVQVLAPLGDDRALVSSVLQSVEPSYRTTDFFNPLQRAAELLQEARHPERAVVLISDFQSSGWTGALEDWKLPQGVTFETVDVGAGTADNAFVEDFRLTRRRAGERLALRFDARVAATGERAEHGKNARLMVGDAAPESRTLPAVSSSPVSFRRFAEGEGVYQGALQLDEDGLTADDSYYFTYTVRARPKILLAEGVPGAPRGDGYFLRSALDIGEAARYEVSSKASADISANDLRDQDVVFLANAGVISGGIAATLQRFVERGGTLVLSFGDGADMASYSRVLETLGTGRLEGPVDSRSLQRYDAIIGEVDLRHPIFSLFASTGTGAILRPRFRRYVRVEPDSEASVLGRYDSGDPFLVERRLGYGKVLTYTATFNTRWTDFPMDELYVPFVYQLVEYGLEGTERRRQFTVGDDVILEGEPGEEWEVRAPGDRLHKVVLSNDGSGVFRETETPGHYVAGRGEALFRFSVNVDPAESRLQARDEEEVYAAVMPPPPDVASTPEQAAAMGIVEDEKRQKLWKYLLVLVVGLFALETYVANRRRGNSDSGRLGGPS